MWRSALHTAAESAGWAVAYGNSSDNLPAELDQNVLIQMSDGSQIAGFNPTDTLVIADSPDAAIATLVADFKISPVEATRAAARFYALTMPWIIGGTTIASATAETLLVPRLGEVRREGVAPTAKAVEAFQSLAFYETLPPPTGARAAWMPGIFEWTGAEPGFVDLTGRRRILQHGPYLELCEGSWKVELQFALLMSAGRCELRFEWGSGADCASHTRLLTQQGVYGLTLEHKWNKAAPSELRIWLDRAMFDGTLEVLDCVVTRMG